MTKERLAEIRALADKWRQEPETSVVRGLGELVGELVEAIPAQCGNVLKGDMGEEYVCALHPSHAEGPESDHTDAFSLAQWPSSVPA